MQDLLPAAASNGQYAGTISPSGDNLRVFASVPSQLPAGTRWDHLQQNTGNRWNMKRAQAERSDRLEKPEWWMDESPPDEDYLPRLVKGWRFLADTWGRIAWRSTVCCRRSGILERAWHPGWCLCLALCTGTKRSAKHLCHTQVFLVGNPASVPLLPVQLQLDRGCCHPIGPSVLRD